MWKYCLNFPLALNNRMHAEYTSCVRYQYFLPRDMGHNNFFSAGGDAKCWDRHIAIQFFFSGEMKRTNMVRVMQQQQQIEYPFFLFRNAR